MSGIWHKTSERVKFLSLLSIIIKNWIGQIDEKKNLTKSSNFHTKQKMLPPVLVQNGVKKIYLYCSGIFGNRTFGNYWNLREVFRRVDKNSEIFRNRQHFWYKSNIDQNSLKSILDDVVTKIVIGCPRR
jgi:hypothetical protein